MEFPKRIRLPHDAYGRPQNVFHVTIRAMPNTAPFDTESARDAIWSAVEGERRRGAVVVWAACLMPDRLHLVVSPDDIGLLKWVNGFKSFTTWLMRADGRMRAIWQPGFYDRLLRSDEEFATALGYLFENPARASLGPWRWVAVWEGASGSEDLG